MVFALDALVDFVRVVVVSIVGQVRQLHTAANLISIGDRKGGSRNEKRGDDIQTALMHGLG